MDKTVEQLESLSVVELKKILHSQNKSGDGITDKDILIQMIVCEDDDETDTQDERKKIQEAHKKIKEYLEKVRFEQMQNEIKRIERLQNPKSKPYKSTESSSQRPNTSIFVENIPYFFKEPELKTFFSMVGPVKRVKVYLDERGKSKGQALVIYESIEIMEKALQYYNNTEISTGSFLKVSIAQFKSDSNKETSKSSNSKQINNNESFICILINILTLEDLNNETYINTIEEFVRGLSQQFGEIISVTHNQEAQILIRFEDSSSTNNCINYWNHREYNGRIIQARIYENQSSLPKRNTTEQNSTSSSNPYVNVYNYSTSWNNTMNYSYPYTSNHTNYVNPYYNYSTYYPQNYAYTSSINPGYSMYYPPSNGTIETESINKKEEVVNPPKEEKKESKLIPIAKAPAKLSEDQNKQTLESFLDEIGAIDTEKL